MSPGLTTRRRSSGATLADKLGTQVDQFTSPAACRPCPHIPAYVTMAPAADHLEQPTHRHHFERGHFERQPRTAERGPSAAAGAHDRHSQARGGRRPRPGCSPPLRVRPWKPRSATSPPSGRPPHRPRTPSMKRHRRICVARPRTTLGAGRPEACPGRPAALTAVGGPRRHRVDSDVDQGRTGRGARGGPTPAASLSH